MMKLFFVLLPLFGCALGLAQDLQPDSCVATCPPPNCPAGDALEACKCLNDREYACKCLNDREYACKAQCPEYIPRIIHCPRLPVSTVSPPEPTPTPCVCEDVICILSFPEGCYCRNDADKACFEKCGGEEPVYQDCSITDIEARAPEAEPVPEPEPAPQVETCVCEDVSCIQSVPDSCYCRNDALKACFEKCGGEEPVYQNCTIIDDVEARVPVPESVPEPEPEPQAEPCVCAPGPFFCPQVWPDSCYCEYNAAKACSDKCGGPAPPFPTHCPPLTPPEIEARVAEPKPVSAPVTPPPTCECPLVNCIQSWPESCYCQNAAKERCYQLCGGEMPILQVCPPQTSSTLLTYTTTAKPTPTPISPRQASPTNQICGGRGGALPPCPEGQVCIPDPFKPGSCGPACDRLGICVGEKLCGGFAGFECDNPGQICVDDPRDDCDPLNGGSDCGGLCAWPQ